MTLHVQMLYEVAKHAKAMADAMPIGKGSMEDACAVMGQPPDWASDLPLRADGYECAYYRKD